MTEQLQKALAEFLSTLTSSLTNISGQIPELVQQLISYNLLKVSIYAAIAFIFMILFLWAAIHCYSEEVEEKRANKHYSEDGNLVIWLIVIAVVFGVTAIYQMTEIVQLYWFPKVWILDYLKELR